MRHLQGRYSDNVALRVRGGGGGGVVRRGRHRGGQPDHGRGDVSLVALQGHRLVQLGVQAGAAEEENRQSQLTLRSVRAQSIFVEYFTAVGVSFHKEHKSFCDGKF